MRNESTRYLQMLGVLSIALLTACTSAVSTKTEKTIMTNTSKVTALLKSIDTGDSAPVAYINPKKYIQHNLAVGDGLEGFGAVLQALPKGSAKVSTVRAFQDGDYVFTHSEYNFFGPKIGFDIFRFEEGLIVEHWDNLQETPQQLNPSNRSMIDGPVDATDHDQTDANKRLVERFVEDVLVNGRMDQLPAYFDGDNYIQHNPLVADQLSGLGAALHEMAQQGVAMQYDRVHKVLGEGSFVLVISEGSFGGAHTSFYDLFRVQGGKIAEHWDTIEAIAPQSEWKNANGKF